MTRNDLFSPAGENERPSPLPCDRWVARSCLQKSIRRGEGLVAVRALANLFLHDPRAIWRHLTIIALEDIGVANVDILRSIVSAKREHSIRRTPGSLWNTFVSLTERLAASEHCQATCDLLLRAENDSSAGQREGIIEAGPEHWAALLYDCESSMQQQAIAALSFGGFVDGTMIPPDPDAVFEICSDKPHTVEIVAVAQNAWKLSRNPMALLLPLVSWSRHEQSNTRVHDDVMPPAHCIEGVPGYGLDQFTKIGKSVIRALVQEDGELQRILNAAGVSAPQWPSIVGDVLFLVEGGLCVRRTIWDEAEALRRPARWLPGTAVLGELLDPATQCLTAKVQKLSELRQQLFHRSR